MKKLTLIISALALMLGLSQCKKPNVNYYQEVEFTNEITFTTGGGAKGSFNQVTNQLKYKWNENDVLHVYSGKEVGGKFQGSKYLGEIPLIDGKDDYEAKFSGKLKGTPESGDNMLRFVHYGTNVNRSVIGEEFNGEASTDFATQTGVLDDISAKVIAKYDVVMNGGGLYSGDLEAQFAVANIKFAHFPGTDITVNGITANKINVAESGDISFTVKDGAKVTPTSLLEDAIGADYYYAVFLPESTSTKHSLTSSGKSYDIEKKFEANVFYSKLNTGDPLECNGKWINGMLPGKFKVDDSGKQVHFAQGNLIYDNGTFYFHENQYDRCFTAAGNIGSNYAETGKFDLFGWGTGSLTEISNRYAQPWLTTTSNPEKYGVKYISEGTSQDEIYMLNANWAGGTNYETYDWAHNNSLIGTKWYTISNIYTKYIIGFDGESYRSGNRYVKGNVNGVNGLIILPDGWTSKPEGDPLYLKNFNKHDKSFSANTITAENWEAYEFAGCVFLPNGGYRSGTSLTSVSNGFYWTRSSSSSGKKDACGIWISNDNVKPQHEMVRNRGCMVRLICTDK